MQLESILKKIMQEIKAFTNEEKNQIQAQGVSINNLETQMGQNFTFLVLRTNGGLPNII